LRDLRFSQYCYWYATPCRLVKLPTFRGRFLIYIQCTERPRRLLLSVTKNSAIVISGVRREGDENCVFLGYVTSGGNSVPTIRDNKTVPSSIVKKQKKRPWRIGLKVVPKHREGIATICVTTQNGAVLSSAVDIVAYSCTL